MRKSVAALPLVGLIAGALVWVVAQGAGDNLVYYQTPGELRAEPAGARVRVGGQVVPRSITQDGSTIRFLLRDAGAQVAVVYTGATPATFKDGQGAVVEGGYGPDGVVHADALLVKHGNRYTPPPDSRG
ncbi:cytochrome c maturation protein CcmE [Amycolatopsis sp. NBC_00345]|uniref:cytochrome c maturation protein CcmE n=1 Tax=Amycolatopsis sp. NBC_00345 TaxID=2975955 RepID=UPI002E2605C4